MLFFFNIFVSFVFFILCDCIWRYCIMGVSYGWIIMYLLFGVFSCLVCFLVEF